MLVFWAVGAAITYLLMNVEWFMEAVGFLAVFTEAMLGLFLVSTYCNNEKRCILTFNSRSKALCVTVLWLTLQTRIYYTQA